MGLHPDAGTKVSIDGVQNNSRGLSYFEGPYVQQRDQGSTMLSLSKNVDSQTPEQLQ